MKYSNADTVLPKELLAQLQKYVQGGLLYVPRPEGARREWGANTRGKEITRERNRCIRMDRESGLRIDELAERYCLSVDSIKKIVYRKT